MRYPNIKDVREPERSELEQIPRDHKLLTEAGYKYVSDLVDDDVLIKADSGFVTAFPWTEKPKSE